MKKKKICFGVASLSDNGVTKVLSILLDGVDYEKYDVSVLLTRKRPHKRKINAKARIIEASKFGSGGILDKIASIHELHRILKTENFDVIIMLGDYAAMYILLGSYFGIHAKKIISERNDPNREPSKRVFRKLRDILFKSADIIVCQTNDAAAYYESIVSVRKVIPNPINEDLPIFEGVRDKRVVNFCRIDEQKNLILLIDSFIEFQKNHPNYSLEIYGEGPLKGEVEAYIESKGMKEYIFLRDFTLDIHEQIKTASMFVSSSDFEGMSNSMLESMAMGLPTVCTDCPIGGAKEVIQSGINGWLVPVNEKEEIVKAMCFIADHPNEAASVALEGTKIRERLSPAKICKQWWMLLEE